MQNFNFLAERAGWSLTWSKPFAAQMSAYSPMNSNLTIAFCCVPKQDTLSIAYYFFNLRKHPDMTTVHPDMTEKLLTGMKSINTSKQTVSYIGPDKK